jgi:hypothetical protein
MPAKMRNKRMAIAMAAAENMLMKDTCFRVLGMDMTTPMIAEMTLKTTVHCEWSDSVLRTFAPVKTWNPVEKSDTGRFGISRSTNRST